MVNLIGNRYEVIERIGTGGMADVFLCFDTVLKRDVALKRLRGDLSHDPVALLRFQREANAASALHHPNIVEVYDVGEQDGQPYIVMELMRGKTAKELIHRRGAIEKYEALSIMTQLVSAVSCAHDAGIIHRDIKPQNILVKDDGTVKIADFGIALANDALQLTKQDSVMGSVHYLAPECVRGEGATIQSDIYAMGIVFYELLTGDVPFRGETSIEVAMKHLRNPLPSILSTNSQLPHSFSNIIAKATQKNKVNRYVNAEEMLQDLNTSLDLERIHEPLWSLEASDDGETIMLNTLDGLDHDDDEKVDAPKWSKKKKMIVGGAVVTAVIAIMTLVIIFWPKTAPAYFLDNIVGMKINEAKELLSEHNIYISDTYSYDYSDNYEEGVVMLSRPAAGTELVPGTQIKVTVSKGKLFEIKDYKGMTYDEVVALFKANTNVTVTPRYQGSTTTEKGIILGQDKLMAGDKIKPDQKYEIVLIVSSEPEIIVPDLRNKPIDAAQKQLGDLGVVSELRELSMEGMSEAQLNALSYGVVIDQAPYAGSYYVQLDGATVVLSYYNKDKRPTPPVDGNPENPDDTNNGDDANGGDGD